MPRTAVTLGKTHEGKWELLAHPDVPLIEQLKGFRQGLGLKAHPEYALISFQESDGHARLQRLRTPEAQEAHEQQQAQQVAAAVEEAKESAKPEEAAPEPTAVEESPKKGKSKK